MHENTLAFLGHLKNKRVTRSVIVRRFFDVINGMPFIRPMHLRAMVRKELGVFIYSKICRNAKAMALRKIEKQYKEVFFVLNNYILELKEANTGSTVSIMAERKDGLEFLVFKRIYICLPTIKEGFCAGCRRIIGLDIWLFLERLNEGATSSGSWEGWEQQDVHQYLGCC